MQVRWSPEALQDRTAIWDYLEANDPQAAARMDRRFVETATKLEDFPFIGHVGAAAGTRELTPHRSYRLIYEVADDHVAILALVHHARQWPPDPTQ